MWLYYETTGLIRTSHIRFKEKNSPLKNQVAKFVRIILNVWDLQKNSVDARRKIEYAKE